MSTKPSCSCDYEEDVLVYDVSNESLESVDGKEYTQLEGGDATTVEEDKGSVESKESFVECPQVSYAEESVRSSEEQSSQQLSKIKGRTATKQHPRNKEFVPKKEISSEKGYPESSSGDGKAPKDLEVGGGTTVAGDKRNVESKESFVECPQVGVAEESVRSEDRRSPKLSKIKEKTANKQHPRNKECLGPKERSSVKRPQETSFASTSGQKVKGATKPTKLSVLDNQLKGIVENMTNIRSQMETQRERSLQSVIHDYRSIKKKVLAEEYRPFLMVGGLPNWVSADDVTNLFRSVGPSPTSVDILKNIQDIPTGHAIIYFAKFQAARNAMQLDNTYYKNKRLQMRFLEFF